MKTKDRISELEDQVAALRLELAILRAQQSINVIPTPPWQPYPRYTEPLKVWCNSDMMKSAAR